MRYERELRHENEIRIKEEERRRYEERRERRRKRLRRQRRIRLTIMLAVPLVMLGVIFLAHHVIKNCVKSHGYLAVKRRNDSGLLHFEKVPLRGSPLSANLKERKNIYGKK